MNKKTLILTILAAVSVLFIMSCGTLTTTPNPQAAADAVTNAYILSPEYSVALEQLKSSGIPYVSELAGVALAGLIGFVGYKNRRLKKMSSVLVENITQLEPDSKEKERIKTVQEEAGVRDSIRKLIRKT